MYNVAVVNSNKHQPAPPPEPSTFGVISSIFATDPRYKGSEVQKVAWDEPQDWTIYTHILMTDEILYVDCLQEFREWMEALPTAVRDRIFNPYGVLMWNVDKTYLQRFQAKGIRTAHTVFLPPRSDKALSTTVKEIQDLMNAHQEGPLTDIVVKNTIDADGVSTRLVNLNDVEKAQAAYNQAVQTSATGVMVQQFLPAIKEDGEWSMVFIDGKLSHGVHKLPKTGEFRVQGTHGGTEMPLQKEEIPQYIRDFGDLVINASSGKLLYARVDVVRNEKGLPCLMEFEAFEPSLFLFTEQIQKRFVDALVSY